MPITIPEKSYFKIGEIEKITGVRQHTLRQWEKEFSALRPRKSKSGQRVYSRRDLEAIVLIDELLNVRKFTVEGAQRELQGRDETRRRMTTTEELPMATRQSAASRSTSAPDASQLLILGEDSESTGQLQAQVRLAAELSERLGAEKAQREQLQRSTEEMELRVRQLTESLREAQAQIERHGESAARHERETEVLRHQVRALESAADRLRERAVEANEIAGELRATSIARWKQLQSEVRQWSQTS
jgi:DNA-binding transcriptional MerR regulator